MRWGRTAVGADRLEVEADRVYLFDVGAALVRPLVVGSLVAYIDGLGIGSGEQRLRPVVMEAGDPATVAVGEEVVVADGQPGGWVHLTFDRPPTLRDGREARLGLHCGPASALARVAGIAGQAGVSARHTSPYGSSPDVTGAATDVGLLASICAVGVEPWVAPDVPDEDLAALPLDVAQAVLGASGPVAAGVSAVCGWHYSNDDPPGHSTAIARTGGPMADLVGERLRVTYLSGDGPRAVAVYLDDEEPFEEELAVEDLSLARGAFGVLAPLWTDTLDVLVEVLA